MAYEDTGRTLTAMFDNRADADSAAAALREIGATDVVLHGEDNPGYGATTRPETEERGFFESLGDFFFPDEDRATYAEGLHRGGYLVTARNVPGHLVAQAQDILDSRGSVDLDTREAEWRTEGWDAGTYAAGRPALAADAARTPSAGMTGSDDPAWRDHDTTGDKIDVVEEQLNIGKRDVDLGTVRVRSYVREIPVSEDVELTRERVDIVRRPVDRAAGDDAFQERSIEARQRGEEAVVEKTARVVEEVELTKNRESHVERVEDTVRKTEVEIEGDDRVQDTARDRLTDDRI